MNIAYSCSKILESQVDDILDYSLMSKGVFKLLKNRVNIDEFITKILMVFEPYFSVKQIHFEVKKTVAKHFYMFDEKRVSQILFNLLVNAEKHTNAYGNV